MPEPVIEADFMGFPGWQSLSPDLQRQFLDAHLPTSFLEDGWRFHYAADPDLTQMDLPSVGRVVRFGERRHRTGGFYCVAVETGHVLVVIRDRPGFVNSSLAAFGATMRMVLGVLKKAEDAADLDECADAGAAILSGVAAIEGTAVESTDWWFTLSDDIAAGDYSDLPAL
jgi:hypothetical protein